jgi:hypothetical protein
LCQYSYGAYECALVTQVLAPDVSWVLIKLLESTKNQRKFFIFDENFLNIQGEIQKKKDVVLSHIISRIYPENFVLFCLDLEELDAPAQADYIGVQAKFCPSGKATNGCLQGSFS